jgi:hypothetical protein
MKWLFQVLRASFQRVDATPLIDPLRGQKS